MPYPVSMSTNFVTLSKPSEPIRESKSSSQWGELLTAIRNVGDFIHKNVIDHFPPTVLGLMYSASMPAIMIPSDESSFGKRHGLEFIKFAVIESAIAMKWIVPVFNNLIFSPDPSELSGESKSSWVWNDPISMEKALRQFMFGIFFDYPTVAFSLSRYPNKLTPGDKLFFDPKNYLLSCFRYGVIGGVIIARDMVFDIAYNYLTVSPASSPPEKEL